MLGAVMDQGFQPPFESKTQQYKIDHALISVNFSTYAIVQWPCVFEGEKYFQKRIAHKGAEARPYWAPRIGNTGDHLLTTTKGKKPRTKPLPLFYWRH